VYYAFKNGNLLTTAMFNKQLDAFCITHGACQIQHNGSPYWPLLTFLKNLYLLYSVTDSFD